MGLIDWGARVFGLRRTSPPVETSRERVYYLGPQVSGIRMTHDDAIRLSAVWACVTVIAKSIASSSWEVFREDEAGNREYQRNSLTWRLLNIRPNSEMTPFAFREALLMQALLWGNGFAEIERDITGRPAALWPLMPERCCLERLPDGRLVVRVDNHSKEATYLDYRDVFHLHGPSIDGIEGFDTVSVAARSLALNAAAETFASAFYGNGTQMGGVLSSANTLTPEQKKDLRDNLNTRHQGPENAFKYLIVDGGLKYEKYTVDQDAAQFTDTRHFLVEEVCRWFAVPPHKIAHLLRCMPADTLVMTESGPREIVDVVVGERVWSVGPDGLRLARVLNNWENGVDEILEISTTNRRFRCNAQHRVLVRRAAERELAPGEIGGRNVDGRKVRLEWRNEYVPAGWLREGDILVALDRIPDPDRRVAPNGRVLTEDFMAFCGLLMGDGNVQKHRGRPVGLMVARADHAGYMDYYRGVMREAFAGCRVRRARVNGDLVSAADAPVVLTEGGRATRLKSVNAASEMDDLGFSGTARTKRVPGWVFGLSEDLRLAFIRGFLDADGTVNKQGRVAFDSANPALIEDVRHLCMSAGVPVTNVQSHVQITMPPGAKRPVTTQMFRFTCSDPKANARIGSHDPRYVARIAAGQPFGRKGRAYPRARGGEFGVDGLSLSKVVSIAHLPAEPVYDIEVEGTHCFVANGVVVHNSTNNNIEHQGIEFVRDALTPWCERLRQEADWKLIPGSGRLMRTRIDTDWLAEGDAKSKADTDSVYAQNGIKDRNEIRRSRGLNSRPEAGDLTAQLNMTTLDKIGQEPVKPAEPPAVEPSEEE